MSGSSSIVSGGDLSVTTSSGEGNDKTAFGELATAQSTVQALIHFPYNINTDIVTETNTGSGGVSVVNQMAVVSSGAAISSSGQIASNRVLEYHPGMGALGRFTAFYTTGVAGNTQIVGIGNSTDGFFFGYNGTSFGILHRSGGSDTWIAQTSWNVDLMDGSGPSGMTLDPTMGNVFQVKYQWLGFGALRFYIENQFTGRLVTVHRIPYTNQNVETSTDNPSFPFCANSTNTSNNSNVTINIGSAGLFIEGVPGIASHTRNSVENEKSILADTPTNILTIRNKSTYQSVTNRIQIQPDFCSIAVDGNKTAVIRLVLNATVVGIPSFVDVRTNNSVVDWDTAGTVVSGGVTLYTLNIAKNGSAILPQGGINIVMSPSDTLTVSAESTNANDIRGSLSWMERFT